MIRGDTTSDWAEKTLGATNCVGAAPSRPAPASTRPRRERADRSGGSWPSRAPDRGSAAPNRSRRPARPTRRANGAYDGATEGSVAVVAQGAAGQSRRQATRTPRYQADAPSPHRSARGRSVGKPHPDLAARHQGELHHPVGQRQRAHPNARTRRRSRPAGVGRTRTSRADHCYRPAMVHCRAQCTRRGSGGEREEDGAQPTADD